MCLILIARVCVRVVVSSRPVACKNKWIFHMLIIRFVSFCFVCVVGCLLVGEQEHTNGQNIYIYTYSIYIIFNP